MDWSTWRPATCLPDCWCEAARHGAWILEPVNTWTNLFFILAGVIFIIKSNRFVTGTNPLSSSALFPRIYGSALIFVGLGSFFYHASQTFVGQWFDVFGMYLVSMFYISYNYYRIGLFDKKRFLTFYFFSCISLGIIIYFYPETRRWLFGLSLIFTFIQSLWIQLRLKSKMKSSYLIGAVLAYALAQALWLLDKNKIWCDPYGQINGHGLWHILTGVSAILAYFYFHSEEPEKESSEV